MYHLKWRPILAEIAPIIESTVHPTSKCDVSKTATAPERLAGGADVVGAACSRHYFVQVIYHLCEWVGGFNRIQFVSILLLNVLQCVFFFSMTLGVKLSQNGYSWLDRPVLGRVRLYFLNILHQPPKECRKWPRTSYDPPTAATLMSIAPLKKHPVRYEVVFQQLSTLIGLSLFLLFVDSMAATSLYIALKLNSPTWNGRISL